MKKRVLKIGVILILSVCIALTLPGLSASADYLGEFTEGVSIGTVKFYSSTIPVTYVELSSGGLPRGLQPTWNEDGAYLTGTPRTTGNYSAEYLVTTSEGVQTVTVSFNVAAAPAAATTEPAEATPAPTAAPRAQMEITKHPYGEVVESGDTREVKFKATAENAERIVWRLVSPDASNTVQCSEASDFFPGLEVSGLGTETLILRRVTNAMNGWYVEAQFWNGNTHLESAGAKITIVDSEGNEIGAPAATPAPTAPAATEKPAVTPIPAPDNNSLPVDNDAKTANISIQPESAEIKAGDSHTFSVLATSPNNGSLSYQWYSAATDNLNAALPIGGASDASYTVENASETAYYWAAIWNVKDGKRSQAVFSESAELKLAVEETPAPLPTQSPEPTPAQRAGLADNINMQLIVFSAIGVLALAALVGVVIFLRKDGKNKGNS